MTLWLMPDGEFHWFDGDRASAIADYKGPAGDPSSDLAQEKIHGPAAGQAAADGLLWSGQVDRHGQGRSKIQSLHRLGVPKGSSTHTPSTILSRGNFFSREAARHATY